MFPKFNAEIKPLDIEADNLKHKKKYDATRKQKEARRAVEQKKEERELGLSGWFNE